MAAILVQSFQAQQTIRSVDWDYSGEYLSAASFDNNILWHNTNNLLYAFKRHYAASLKSSGIDFNTKKIGNMTVDDYLGYLFDYTGYKEEPSLVLERKLIGTRTPRELFDRKW